VTYSIVASSIFKMCENLDWRVHVVSATDCQEPTARLHHAAPPLNAIPMVLNSCGLHAKLKSLSATSLIGRFAVEDPIFNSFVATLGILLRVPSLMKELGNVDQSGRPTEWYSKPRDFMWAGERRLRPSRTKGRTIVSRMRGQSRSRNSSHSVRITTASAPSAA